MRTWIREYLGITKLEDYMSEITDALNRLAEQVNGVSAAQATSFHNLQVAIDDLKAGNLTPEQQEIVGRIESSLTKLGEDAQAADDGYEPAQPEQPTEPTEPGDGTDTPPADGDTPTEGVARRR